MSVNDDDILEESTEVRIKKLQLITLVQTDKPIYKPGQTGMLITLVHTDKPIYKPGQTGMLITLVHTDKPISTNQDKQVCWIHFSKLTNILPQN